MKQLAPIIVSRHPAGVAFIRQHLPNNGEGVPVMSSVTAEDIRGKEVFGGGDIPLFVAAQAVIVWAIEFKGPAPRGEYSLEDMLQAGAYLAPYVVRTWDQDPDRRTTPWPV